MSCGNFISYRYCNFNLTQNGGAMKIITSLLLTLLFFSINTVHAQEFNFSQDSVITVGNTIRGMVCEDFNNDSLPDIAVTLMNASLNNPIAIYLNDGSGVISTTSDSMYENVNFPMDIACGDFNNDDNVDLVFTTPDDSGLVILTGNGDGTFNRGDSINVDAETWKVAVADFDKDLNDDIVVDSRFARMYVINGNGDGSFEQPVEYFTGGTSSEIETCDLNGDGYTDLVIGLNNSGQIAIYLNDQSGGFPVRSNYYTYRTSTAVEACFFDNDTIPDIVFGSGSWDFDTVFLLKQDSTGDYSLADTSNPCGYVTDISVGDYNYDGNLDVLVGNNNGLYVVSGNNGIFDSVDSLIYNPGIFTTRFLQSCDINSDGRTDIIAATTSWISVFYNIDPALGLEKINHNEPVSFNLLQNYPNPFNPLTKITFEISTNDYIDVSIFNSLGQKITTLASGQKAAGKYTIQWNASNFAGGVYYCRLTNGSQVQIRKIVYLK